MEGSSGAVCTSGVVCRDGGHFIDLVQAFKPPGRRSRPLQALRRHAGPEMNPALQRHGSTKILATVLAGLKATSQVEGRSQKNLQTFCGGCEIHLAGP